MYDPHSGLTRNEMESRRLAAAACLSPVRGSAAAIARQFGVSRTSASRWAHQVATGQSMRKKRAPGRPARITLDQWRAVFHSEESWTCFRFADAILERLGVHYSSDHAGRILQKLRKEGQADA